MTSELVAVTGLTEEELRRSQQGIEFHCGFFGIKSKPYDPSKVSCGNERPTPEEILTQAIESQQKFPSLNPRSPRTPQAKKLFKAVLANLPNFLRDRLRLYCTIDTPLDYSGIDGLFAIDGHSKAIATFDLALYRCRNKMRELRAHLLITLRDISRNKVVEKIGRAIARRLVRSCKMYRKARFRRQKRDKEIKRDRRWREDQEQLAVA